MSSYTNSSKLVRTESMLDEYNTYFSHVFAPLKNINQKKTVCSKNIMQQQHEDVDAEAEEYIKKRHQKFAFAKWV